MGLKSEDSYAAQLQAILRIAHDLKEVAAVSLPPSHPPSIPSCGPAIMDSINLPAPRPLFPLLIEAGFSHEIATAASSMYLQRAEELRHHIQKSIMATWLKLADLPVSAPALSLDLLITKVVSTSTEMYLRRLERWKEEIVHRIKQISNAPPKVAPRNAFNHEYVPLLERFFEDNPFPTHADKMFLAKKSNMQYKQIHVWFQNRRNRTKKEGKVMRKKPTYGGPTESLHDLYEHVKGHMVEPDSQAPETPKVSSSDGEIEIETAGTNVSKDVFTSSSPPHAFPSSYPPTCHYDPFPCKSGLVHFSKPEWRRTLCPKLPLPLSTSIDELVERFSQLNVRDETRSRRSPKLQSHAATAAITVILSRAPHPSLIVRKDYRPTHTVRRCPIVRAPVSSSRIFQSASPSSKPVTLVPSPIPLDTIEFPRKRKTAPLPRRFPGRMRNTCRDTTPSESWSTSSTPPRLFSPDSRSRSCSSSSIGSASTPSDVASTQELPHLSGPLCRSPFDSPIHLYDLGDVAAIISSSVS